MDERSSERVRLIHDVDPRLRNVVRFSDTTCWTCGEPAEPFWKRRALLCWHCRQHHYVQGIADHVLPIVYAVAGERTATLLRRYKDAPSRATWTDAKNLIGSLVAVTMAHCASAIDDVADTAVTVRTTVPSLTFRPGPHPFARILRESGIAVEDVLTPRPDATCQRLLDDKFDVTDPSRVSGRHVLVLDDVWTTGSTAQSAALALRRSGAAEITLMPVGRWINPAYPPSAAMLASQEPFGFDPARCVAGWWPSPVPAHNSWPSPSRP